ncbi:MAG: hypothetical protein HQL61_05610 [Magnetococcales bacterium]|nr:hypothetical protein [Nitrospirota bacterium]
MYMLFDTCDNTFAPLSVRPERVYPVLGVIVHVDEPPLVTVVGVQEIEPPVPAVAVTVYCPVVPDVNVAVTFLFDDMVTAQVGLDPEQSPPQVKVEPEAGAAVRVIGVPESNWAVQGEPALQLIPAGLLVTFPEPLPETVTVKVAHTFPLHAAYTDCIDINSIDNNTMLTETICNV